MIPPLLTRMRFLQLSDSAFPVGTFSFSNGLEAAVQYGVVYDAASLQAYVEAVSLQAAYTDGVAALHAFRAAKKGDYAALREADCRLIARKMNEESRQMLQRMGRKLAELGEFLFPSPLLEQWLEEIRQEQSPGCYPIAQGVAFAWSDLSEEELFASHQYGVVNMMLSAALRIVKVSHYDTQAILASLARQTDELFASVRVLSLEQMAAFAPQADVLASLHEKGNMRMFMS